MPVPRPLRWLISVGLVGGIVLGVSGRWTDPVLLTYVAVWAVVGLLGTVLVPEETVQARLRGGPAGADRLGLVAFRVLGPAHLVIGALDAGRLHWSAGIAPSVRFAAIAGLGVALGWMFWAVAVNRFFMPAVRIQSERGHHVITTGPYALVRHPGYAGMCVAMPLSALGLGSWAALFLALGMAGFVLRRVAIEDRLVRAELPGYEEYADRVRYRLVPGVW
jgi:protein-S-isoprenylcysteine O-methyltransferase Ste14